MRGILALIEPWDRSTNSYVPIYVGASRNSSTLRIGGARWETAMVRLPRISMEFVDDDITGQLMLAKGDMTLAAALIKQVADVDALEWVGAQIVVWSGNGPLLSDMRVEFKGRVIAGVKNRDTGQIPLVMQVDRKMVDVPLLNLEYGGGGGADGDPEVRGQLKPAAFGRPINVPVFFFDQVNNVGQIDGYGGMIDCLELYEDGGRFGDKLGDFATYAALVAADIPEGSWATCIAEGMIRLGAPPQGVITADPVCHGDRPGSMALRWLTTFAGVSAANIDDASFDALTAQVEALLGHEAYVSYWTQSQVNLLDRLQTLCASCNAMPLLGVDGRLSVSRVFGGDVELVIDRQGGRPLVTGWRSFDPTTPWWRLKMSAAVTWRVHTPAEIDFEDDIDDRGDYVADETYRIGQVVRQPTNGIRYLYIANEPSSGNAPPDPDFWEVYEDAPDASVVKYVDGTPVEALKPAQAGADQTSSHTAAAIAGQGMLATEDYAQLGSSVMRQDGVTAVTDASAITALGTAASIAGQGALATRGDVYFDSGYIKESVGGSNATLTGFKTALGTASAIAGQGALATRADIYFGSAYLLETVGGAQATLSNFKTSVGTASAIAGQGALATLAQVNLGTSGRVYRDDGVTRLTDNLAVTSLGTAAAIAGQGAFATVNTAAYGSGLLTGFGTLAPRNNVRLANEVYRADGTTVLSEAAAVTSLGTASAIAGQGALATLAQVNFGASGRVYRDDGVTRVTDTLAITSLGTASAIAGQGALATLAQVNLGASGRVYRDDGVTRLTDALAVTALGTASAIAGQGALATLNAASWSTQVTGVGKPSSFATANVTYTAAGGAGAVWTQEGNSFSVTDSGGENAFWIASEQPIVGPFIMRFRHNAAWWVFVAITGTKNGVAGDTGHALFLRGDNLTANAYNPAASISGVSWAYTAGAIHEIWWDGRFLRYLLDGVVKRSVTNDYGTVPLYFTAIWNAGAAGGNRLYDIEFLPANDKRAYRDDAATVMGQAEIRTAEGTASAIAGQGALATKSTANLDTDVAEGTTYKRVAAEDVGAAGVLKLSTSGSGRKLGGSGNLPNVVFANQGSKFTGSISYTAAAGTPATATISATAGNLVSGALSTSYNALSVGVTGTGGTTVAFYLYGDDPTNAGGSITLNATTTPLTVYQADSRIWFGSVSVFFPSSGTGGGTGGGGGGGGGYTIPMP